ncbi:MAG: PSD1 domain-containing protein [Planctomycetaceae bacterium]|nr:PSD1 domain-containing protein [Planctomycetaceae bacterium]
MSFRAHSVISAFVVLLISALAVPAGAFQPPVDFNRDIRPILSDKCLTCHGPDEATREGNLRLDDGTRFSGGEGSVIVPGKSAESELYQRISATDPDIAMPPREFNKQLNDQQKELIRRWIDQGGEWETHWAYAAVVKHVPPEIAGQNNPIDQFIRSPLSENGIGWASEADRVTLIRRIYFDLIGLPPSWQQVQSFVNDGSPNAWEKVVDELLQSPHFGERLAIYWLDVVRFADSNGYHSDEPRKIAPYRDYVIHSFNSNKPFDQFVIEQLAGDLLPNPSTEQMVASGFNMLLQTTSEGGGQPKEYIAKYAADRVRNTSQIFLGTTMGCAECHNHKYDPITIRDFYSFAAFFADIEQPAIGNPATFPVMTDDDRIRLQQLNDELARLNSEYRRSTPELTAAQEAWEAAAVEQVLKTPVLSEWETIGPFTSKDFDDAYAAEFLNPAEIDTTAPVNGLKWESGRKFDDGKVHDLGNTDFSSRYFYRTLTVSKPTQLRVSLGSDDAVDVWLNGKSVHRNKTNRAVAADQDAVSLDLQEGANQLLVKVTNGQGASGFYFKASLAEIPQEISAVLVVNAADRTKEQQEKLSDYFRSIAPETAVLREQIASMTARKKSFEDNLPRTMMTKTSTPKVVRVLNRGNWMDDTGPIVEPAIPSWFGTLPSPEGKRPTRLELARWIVDRNNPLTSRTMVNRLWKLYFGQGLASPLDDLGRQGTLPTHPELLDWMAAEFMDSHWDLKRMIRTLVTSNTYRQSSLVPDHIRSADPYNQRYARQSRFRLDAELVRDNALSVSGLLIDDVGGRSVFPYQPAGYWSHLNFPVREWPGDSGEQLYRRGLYTWWQRMFLHPGLLAFDAPTREECTVERPRSNIPQQALVLLNDPTYVEAARAFAARILQDVPSKESDPDLSSANQLTHDRLNYAYRVALSRDITKREEEVLAGVLHENRKIYSAHPDLADGILAAGQPAQSKDKVELATWTSVTRTLFNLSEFITRP